MTLATIVRSRALILAVQVLACGLITALGAAAIAPAPQEPVASAPEDIGELKARAEQGDPEAQYRLGVYCLTGINREVPRDYEDAARWYRLAAEQGVSDAQYNLGQLHSLALDAPPDPHRAARWMRLAAEQGHLRAQYRMGNFYRIGIGVTRDNVSALVWLSLAAAGGHEKANRERKNLADRMTPEELAQADLRLREH